MTTLRLDPAAAAARAARRTAQHTNPPPIVAPERTVQAAATAPSKKALKKAGMRAVRQRFKALWPHLFSRADVPLAIGIRHDIAKYLSEEEQNWLAPTLASHCRTPAYLHALMQPGACRVDLAGNLTPVSPEHAARVSSRPIYR